MWHIGLCPVFITILSGCSVWGLSDCSVQYVYVGYKSDSMSEPGFPTYQFKNWNLNLENKQECPHYPVTDRAQGSPLTAFTLICTYIVFTVHVHLQQITLWYTSPPYREYKAGIGKKGWSVKNIKLSMFGSVYVSAGGCLARGTWALICMCGSEAGFLCVYSCAVTESA